MKLAAIVVSVACLLLCDPALAIKRCHVRDPNSTTIAPPTSSKPANASSSAPVTTAPVTLPTTSAATTTKPVTTKPAATATTATPTATSSSGKGFARFFDEASFKATFPNAIALYTFQGLVNAAAKYPTFANTGDDTKDKQELAAFLGQTAHECDQFKAAEEYARDSYPESQYCQPSTEAPCAPGHRYHGRGPIQLSWNYNYYAAGKALGVDLLNKPELVGTDKSITWQTALWYWMTPQKAGRIIHNVVTLSDGFAQATDIINGGLECNGGVSKANEQSRITYYKQMCAKLGVQPVAKVSCNA